MSGDPNKVYDGVNVSRKKLRTMIAENLADKTKKLDNSSKQEDELYKYIFSVVRSKSTSSDKNAIDIASMVSSSTTDEFSTPPPKIITSILKNCLRK